jgi:hypothetical protein
VAYGATRVAALTLALGDPAPTASNLTRSPRKCVNDNGQHPYSLRWFAGVTAGSELNNTLTAIAQHPSLFVNQSIAVYKYGDSPFDDKHGISFWWSQYMREQTATWLPAMKKAGLKVMPYATDTSNAFKMEAIWANQTAVIADLISIAHSYGFDGWFVDYEAEAPAEWAESVDESPQYALFLDSMGTAFHAAKPPLTLGAYVNEGWTKTSSNYPAVANSATDAIVSGAIYGNVTDGEWTDTGRLVEAVIASSNPDCSRASIGLGPYYYTYWNATAVQSTITRLDEQLGVRELTIFQLPALVEGLPQTSFWWDELGKWLQRN